MSKDTKKPAKAKKNTPHVGEETIMLRHDFTDKEFREVAGKLNVAMNTRNSLESALDTLKKDYNAKITQQEGVIDEMNNKLGNGYEMRDTKVVVVFDPAHGRKRYFMPDDKKRKKCVAEADMMPSDYQTEHPALLPKPPETPAVTPPNVVPMTGEAPPATPENALALRDGKPLVSVGEAVTDAEREAEHKRVRALAIEVIRSESKASVSLIQRRLKIGYALATAIIDGLERDGVIGPANGSEPRAILALPDPEPSGTPAHDTANPPPAPEKRKSGKRKPTKAEFQAQQEAKGEGDK
jgi:DNA segregation ATPase FtsK/SpoIIIE-like protein